MWTGGISLTLAALAYVPSAAVFTPAIVLTLVAFVGSVMAAALGAYRLAVLTLYFVCATFLTASSSFSGVIRTDYLMVVMGFLGVVLGTVVYRQYTRSKADE